MSHPHPNPHIVVACDKFKGSLTAVDVAKHIQAGIATANPNATTDLVYVADGGDGTLDAALAMGFDRVAFTVEGPTGDAHHTAYAYRDHIAVVEMADACGLVHVPTGQLAPLTASSFGLGEVLATVLDQSTITEIVLGVGGSASTDGGAGMLQALGARFVDADGKEVGRGGGALRDVVAVDCAGLHPRLQDVQITLASDVNNPLLGDQGAATIFGPQKGATPDDVATLETALTHYVSVLGAAFPDAAQIATQPGAGAAGGVGFAALVALGATMRPGIELMLDLADFKNRVRGADLVITGEGALDAQSLSGKTPVGVSHAAHQAGVPVVAVCGKLSLTPNVLAQQHIQQAHSLLDAEPDVAVCMQDAGRLLEEIAAKAVQDWANTAFVSA